MSPNAVADDLKTTSGSVRVDHRIITATGKERTRLLSMRIAGIILILMTGAYIYLVVTKSDSPGLLAFIGTGFGLLMGKGWGHGD